MRMESLNIFIGVFGFALVFTISASNNTIETASLRGLLAFLFFFLMSFLLKWVIRFILTDTMAKEDRGITEVAKPEEAKGNQTMQEVTEDQEFNDFQIASQYVKELLREEK